MNNDTQGLIRLNKSDVKTASEVLGRAFLDYPVSVYAMPDESRRKKRMPYFFQYVLYYCVKYGEGYTVSPDIEGIALWLTSEYYPMTVWRMLSSVPLSVFLRMGIDNPWKMMSLGQYIDAVHKRLVPERHWFLQTLGVDPSSQGKGYASRLLRPMLARIDREGLPCYLETMDTKDVPVYEHFGFKVIDESNVPGTGLTNWAMVYRKGFK